MSLESELIQHNCCRLWLRKQPTNIIIMHTEFLGDHDYYGFLCFAHVFHSCQYYYYIVVCGNEVILFPFWLAFSPCKLHFWCILNKFVLNIHSCVRFDIFPWHKPLLGLPLRYSMALLYITEYNNTVSKAETSCLRDYWIYGFSLKKLSRCTKTKIGIAPRSSIYQFFH